MKCIKLTENQLYDYMKCPIHYDSIHNKKFSPPSMDSMSQFLGRIWNVFCSNLLVGTVLSTSQLKQRWDQICEANQDVISDRKSLEGLNLLMKMYRWAERTRLTLRDYQIPYQLTFKYDDITVIVTGNISNLVMDKSNTYYIVDADFSNKIPDQSYLDMKLKYTLQLYAMHKVYKTQAGVNIHNIKNDKDFYTMRAREDFKRLESTVHAVAVSISNNLYYPRESPFCMSCDLLHFCRAWH